ncbi:MAG TPA: hypothetical protein VMA83_01170 [Solirubrobacteraceae bacterium]|nr:hypothetical protein [Solirubrobacteraceae bacterium]
MADCPHMTDPGNLAPAWCPYCGGWVDHDCELIGADEAARRYPALRPHIEATSARVASDRAGARAQRLEWTGSTLRDLGCLLIVLPIALVAIVIAVIVATHSL